MKQNYNYSLQQVLLSEGGYTNDPRDPGGPTNFGITIYDYRAYIDHNGNANDVRNMTQAQAAAIYRSKYWNAVDGDNLPSGVDYCVFDYGVNSGNSRALKVYKEFEDKTPEDCINAICDERLAFLKSLSTWSHFGAGWSSRVARVRSQALQLAAGALNSPTPSIPTIETEVTSVTNIFTTIKQFFKDNFKTNIPLALGSASAFFTKDWPYILGGAVLVAGLLWLGFYLYERKLNGYPNSIA
jgi:lysozyme family protein